MHHKQAELIGELKSREHDWKQWRDREVIYVIHCRDNEADPRRAYRVIAWSFTEFLALTLENNKVPYFYAPGYQERGDAFSEPRYSGEFPLCRFREEAGG